MYESSSKNLYQQRRDKLADPLPSATQRLTYAEATYPNNYAATHTIPGCAAYDSLTAEQLVRAIHRVSPAASRPSASGQAGFAQLSKAASASDLRSKDDVGENAFALYKLLDLGDPSAFAAIFRTRTAAPVHVAKVGDHSHNLPRQGHARPADKYHGLEEPASLPSRYVDLFANTGATKPISRFPPQPREHLGLRAHVGTPEVGESLTFSTMPPTRN